MYKEEMKTRVTLPAGKYWLGDPCYTIPNSDWHEWLEAANYTQEINLLAKVPGREDYAIGFSTAFGDGCYPYQKQSGGNWSSWESQELLPVDAGLIGFVPFDVAPDHNETLSVLVEFDRDTQVEWQEGNLEWWVDAQRFRVLTDESEEFEEDNENVY